MTKQEWLTLAETKNILQEISRTINKVGVEMAAGSTFDEESTERTSILTAKKVGFCSGLAAVSALIRDVGEDSPAIKPVDLGEDEDEA